jgi:anaerobic selenocysteine-containing dehydrogenase
MIVESANPAHPLADGARMRVALSTLDGAIVIDVTMTATARLADYLLPTPAQYEKQREC